MKTLLVFLSFAVFGVTFSSCENRIRRQIWPPPQNPGFWPGNFHNNFQDNYDFFDDSNPWMGPPRFDQPSRVPNGFRRDNFGFGDENTGDGRGNNGMGGNRRDDNGSGGNRRDESGNGGRNQNQNRRTTEILGSVTTTPRTLHYAPEGCDCLITQQFNPVCGSDGVTYKNRGLLNCYRRCGRSVSEKRLGAC